MIKYWAQNEIQILPYWEGSRILPYHHPASIVKDANGSVVFECEIVPFTETESEYVDHITFETVVGKCVLVEIRQWKANKFIGTYKQLIPLNSMGYDKEPENITAAYNRAMKVI